MSRTEQRRGWLVTKVLAGELTVAEAAPLLALSERQVWRLVAAMRHSGPAGLVHGNRGRASPRRLPDPDRERIVDLARGKYAGVNDSHLAELLAEQEQIVISRQALRRLLRDAGLASPRRRRRPRHRSRRDRMPQAGLLLQVDGSRHDWLEGRGPRDLVPTVLLGYELPPSGLPAEPPGPGEVIADTSLESEGVEEGTVLRLGPARSEVRVVGFVDDSQYAGQGTLWGSLDTWRQVLDANRPGARVAGGAVQALVVRAPTDTAPADLPALVDGATDGATDSYTIAGAIDALPGLAQQRSVFGQIIGVTLAIAVVVVALFFALLTVERTALYGVLKALGASSATIFAGVLLQALAVTGVAVLAGVVAGLALDAVVPPGSIPFTVTPARLTTTAISLVLAAVVGCATTVRRVLRIDPASAIGRAQ